jgi:hypothetical protein
MKRYLTGIDWIVNSIDYTSKSQSGIGNHSELILELKNSPGQVVLEQTLNYFNQKFPLLTGYPSRAANLCPYWKVPKNKESQPLRLQFIKLNNGDDYLPHLANLVNTPFKNKREHLVFTLIEAGERNFLAMAFDHRILDAKGAEAFLHFFQQFYQNHKPLQLSLACPPHLNNWKEKFMAGRQISRFFLNLAKQTPRILPLNLKDEPCKFKVISLDPVKASALTKRAYSRAGYLMIMPYLLAKTIQIMHQVFQEKNVPGSSYLIPVPMDMRNKDEAHKESLFNHFSFFIFSIETAKVNDLNWLLSEIKNQMYEQVKNKVPEAIANGSFLMRIAPLALTDYFLKLMSNNNFASFAFSYLSNAYQQTKFMEEDVQNIFHLPRTPKPPGIGIFFNQFDNKINIAISYFDDLLSQVQVNRITKDLEALGDED